LSDPTRPFRSAPLAIPVLLYGFAVLAAGLQLGSFTVIGVLLMALPLAAPWTRRVGHLLWIPPGVALMVGFLLALPSQFALTSPGVALLAGVFVGSPLTVLAALLIVGREPTAHLLVLLAGLADLSALLATLSGRLPMTPGAFANGFFRVFSDQSNGLGTLVSGGSPGVLPLQGFHNTVVTLLAVPALAGAFLAFLLPETEGAVASAPPASRFGPVAVGAGAAVAFELVAVEFPDQALLALAVAVAATVVALVALARPRRPPAPDRRPPAERAPTVGSP